MPVEIKNVCYSYGSFLEDKTTVFSNLNLSIKSGEAVAVMGPTGSGKSTLLKLIGNILKPDSGEIRKSGSVGVLLQNPERQLFGDTVLSDVMYGAENLGLKKEDAEHKAIQALSAVGISERYYKCDPLYLSYGEQRKVAVSGIIAMDPDIIIADEPSSGLDYVASAEISALFKTLCSRGKTVIISTHDSLFAKAFASRLIVVVNGNVVRDGSPDSVLSAPDIENYGIESIK